jgi:UDP-N-acetyl-alpha-D-muramoyl-L-alanyl-L-glutamate epimerase
MLKSYNAEKFLELRNEFPVFSFDRFEYQFSGDALQIQFFFNLSDRYFFHPSLTIPVRDFFVMENVPDSFLSNIIFHIGMVEMISYWKATCSPVIAIKGFSLDERQVQWWKKLFKKGLGEFLYLNSIHVTQDEFVSFRFEQENPVEPSHLDLRDSVIIPIGGGKDSAVTLELLNGHKGNIPLLINPREASRETVLQKGYYYDSVIEVHRTIDPTLLELNEAGFLNGHTPFSALLAFVSVLASGITGRKYIALSNESSANESTIPGMDINHQYSKTVEFEEDFRFYVNSYITGDINYFSFLRPLGELQIARIFSDFPHYFSDFKSCNAGSKTDTWCGKCPKCLFTFIILSPFLGTEMLTSIFGKNLWEDKDLIPVLDQLTGNAPEKPFDCIGTVEEVNTALCELLRNEAGSLKYGLLDHYTKLDTYSAFRDKMIDPLLHHWDPHNFLPEKFSSILKSYLHV